MLKKIRVNAGSYSLYAKLFEMVDSIIKLKNMISSDASLETKSPDNTVPKFNVNVEFQIAKLWHQKGKIDRAIAGYRKVLAVNPMHWSSLLALDELLTIKGEDQTAIALYRQAIQNLAVIESDQPTRKKASRRISIVPM